jgi:AraC-like DNA-binding protein
MELLNAPGIDDPISEVLRRVRVRSTVFCRSILGAPWGFGIEAHGNPVFHIVTKGDCWLQTEGEPRQTHLAEGDLVLVATARRHWIRNDPATPAPELEQLLLDTPLDQHLRLHYGGTGHRTDLLCGGFALEGGDAHPILQALPSVVHLPAVDGRPLPWVAATLELVSAEMGSDAPGSEVVLGRLADGLLTQALRAALANIDGHDGAQVLALRNPEIASAIKLIHRLPERAWTVGQLADEVALSRSTFAARFRQVVGESPKRYITRTRLAHAATLLQTTNATLADIAARSGYATEFSFNKAFKRLFGLSPGAYRGQAKANKADLFSSRSSSIARQDRVSDGDESLLSA